VIQGSMLRIICLGHSSVDTIYGVAAIPATPTKVLASSYTEAGGGMAANASVAAARLGAEVEYWGRVGEDGLGVQIVAWLDAEGVSTRNVRRIPGARSPRTAVLVDDSGERLICGYNDPALDDDPSWLPVASLAGCGALLADVRWRAGAARALDVAREAGVPSILDADIAPVESLHDLCARCDYAIFSQGGLAAASGASDPGDGLRRMAQISRGLVGVTLGEDGFLWLETDGEKRAAAPQVTVVDTLAAGDVFHAAFTLGIAERKSVAEAARFANAAAALKCTRPGGRLGAPTRREVEALLTTVS
jgi:sulfofructose kinase